VLMLFHASREEDLLIRRLYGMVGGLGLPLTGVVFSLMPVFISLMKDVPEGGTRAIQSLFFPFGWICFFCGLFYLILYCKNETEEANRRTGLQSLLVLGVLLAGTGFIGSFWSKNFVLTYGAVLIMLGLVYLCSYISQRGGADGDGYQTAFYMGIIGAIVFLAAIGLSFTLKKQQYFVPAGFMLIFLGGLYMMISLFLVSDWQIIVLTRREIAGYFYSPIAYLVLLINVLVGFFNYDVFTARLARGPMLEPILGLFMFGNLFSVFVVVFIVPALSMRLMSEEKRTGTYEVLMCAPVSESTVLLSKLFSSVMFYMLTWSVWGIYLLALRTETGVGFEYRPLLSLSLTFLISGFTLMSMGLFFSCLTKNQIVAAGLTFFGMLAYVALFFAGNEAKPDTFARMLYNNLSFFHLWFESLNGKLHLREVVLQFSLTFFWFYLALKVLEARRWS
jgi:ABC-2 type transport system permease protein